MQIRQISIRHLHPFDLGRCLDGFVGAQHLRQDIAARLLAERIRILIRMMPLAWFGATLVSAVLLAIAYGQSIYPTLMAWCSVMVVVQGLGVGGWLRERAGRRDRPIGPRAMRSATRHAFVLGLIWGCMPLILAQADNHSVHLVASLAVGFVVCGAGVIMMTVPRAAFAFILPMVLGALAALAFNPRPLEAVALGVLLVGLVVVLAIVIVRHAREAVRRLDSESRLREQRDIIGLLLKEFEEHSCDWLWEFDAGGRMNRVSPRFAAAAGASPASLLGDDFCSFLGELIGQADPAIRDIEHAVARRATFTDVQIRFTREGRECWWSLTGKPSFNQFGHYAGYIGTGQDITGRKQAELRIRHLAHKDPLTGLLNRSRFNEQIERHLVRLQRYGTPFTLLYVDLDHFKAVNDSHGHMVGDLLLVQASARLRACVREAGMVARLGGDEFAVILSVADEAHAAGLCAHLIAEIGRPYDIGGDRLAIGVSVGIAMAPEHGTSADQLVRHADIALYRAKADGRSAFRFFELSMLNDTRYGAAALKQA